MKLLSGNKIRSLDNQVNMEPSLMPKPSFIAYLVASRGSGKTVALINLLVNKDMLANKFNQIYILSPTNKLDSKWNVLRETDTIVLNHKLIKLLNKEKNNHILDSLESASDAYNTRIPAENFIEDVSVDLLKNLIEEQKHIIEVYGKDAADNILIVYDDTISSKKFFSSEAVQKLIFNSRHFKISLIITSQAYHSLPKCLRLNVSMMILFFTGNKKELETIYEENSSSLGFKDFENKYNEVTQKPFNFMCINYQNPMKFRLQSAFEHFI